MEWNVYLTVFDGVTDDNPQTSPGTINREHVFYLDNKEAGLGGTVDKVIIGLDYQNVGDQISGVLYAEDDSTQDLDWGEKKWDIVWPAQNYDGGTPQQSLVGSRAYPFNGGGRYYFRVTATTLTAATSTVKIVATKR